MGKWFNKRHDANGRVLAINVSFRTTYMLLSFIALCVACIISLGVVLLLMKVFFTGHITELVVIIAGIMICSLSILIGGFILWKASDWFSKPIVAIDDAVQKVASGDFDTVVESNHLMLSRHRINNELTTLVENFNKMTQELNRIEYMSKDFMSNVSHEIKTPIATLTGITEMLMEEGLDKKEQQEYIEIVNETSEQISSLCDSMLQVSKLDNQKIIEKKDIIRLDEQIRKAFIQVTELHPEDERDVELDLEEVAYACNKNLIYQVWVNLIDNAYKYSPEKSKISIVVEENPVDSDAKAGIVVRIYNEGDTIPTEKIEKMFDRFYQCDESHKDKGNGLGLSIVSRIVKLHNGEIHCVSDKGTTMIVEL